MNKRIKVLIDTDVCNEIDDQFAICYALARRNNLQILGFTVAPFPSKTSHISIRDGLIDSKNETNHIIRLFGSYHDEKIPVLLGCDGFLSDGYNSLNPAVEKILELAKTERNFVICCLGPLTNVAMAIRIKPEIAKKLKVVWLGTGNILLDKFSDTNFTNDKQAFYEVLSSQVKLTVVPSYLARSVVTSKYEFYENTQKNPVTDFLKTLFERFDYIKKEKEIKAIYDIVPICYLLNREKFLTRTIDGKLLDKENILTLPKSRMVKTIVDLPKYSFVWLDFLNSINSIVSNVFTPKVFFISDTHFNHERKVRLKQVPFKTVEEMNSEIVRRWNSVVGINDIVYHLGDFGDYDFVKKLNGKIILICGNYEKEDFEDFAAFRSRLMELGFADVIKNGMYLPEDILGERVYLTHKPTNHAKSCMTLFGHVHSLKPIEKFGFNVCCAYHYFTPVTAESVKRYLDFIHNHADEDVFVSE